MNNTFNWKKKINRQHLTVIKKKILRASASFVVQKVLK